jgi:hypothetical protein
MRRIKITEQQYKKLLSEMEGVKGGLNRVDTNTKKEFKKVDVLNLTPNKSLMEEPDMQIEPGMGSKFNIKRGIPGIEGSKMKTKTEPSINEDIFSPEFHQAIHNFIQNIWMNPSQRGLDRVFVENGITWGDIVTYLTSVGVLAGVGAGMYKVKNYFKTRFSQDERQAEQQKMQDIEKLTKMVEKDPQAPWNQETTYEKKQKMQARPETGWKSEPKPFNANRFKPGLDEDEPDENNQSEPRGYGKWSEPEPQRSMAKQIYKPVGMGKELAVFNGPDGMYIFDYSNYSRSELPNPDFDLDIEDVTDFVNDNLQNISTGEGVQSFEHGDDLVKIDEELKEYLAQMYSKDKEFIKLLNRLEETTASSAGAFTGPLGAGKAQVSPGYTPAQQIGEIINDEDAIYGKKIEETTAAAGGTPQSSSTGQYTQPKIWAKDKANWAASKRTQYPHGEMVDFDPCTKLNNNKKAQQGKCSQGAIDNVVKTHTTPQSVISKSIYEAVAKKTGRTVEDVKRIIAAKNKKQ